MNYHRRKEDSRRVNVVGVSLTIIIVIVAVLIGVHRCSG